jgi:hypothetical protein
MTPDNRLLGRRWATTESIGKVTNERIKMGLPGPSRRITVTPEPVTAPPPAQEPERAPEPVPVEPE